MLFRSLYDALDDALRKIKRGEHEKKAILLLTDGQDMSSVTSFDEAKLSVRESEVLVYCVGISPSTPTSGIERNPVPGQGDPPIILGGPGRTGPNGPVGGPTGRTPTGRGGTIGLPIPGLPTTIPIPIPGRRPNEFQAQGPRRTTGGPGGNNPSNANPDIVDMDVLNAFADASGAKAWLLNGN